MDQEPQLDHVLDVFLHLCGKGNEWILRNDIHKFDCGISYDAAVETIQSNNEATLIIGRRSNGTPLMWNEDWDEEDLQFCRVMLRVERLRPDENLPPYGKTTRLHDVLCEGDHLAVKICPNDCVSSPKLFSYHAISGWIIRHSIKRTAENIRRPLRGCVGNINENEQVGLINFGTYDGRVAKAVFFTNELYVRGEKYCGSLNSVTPFGTKVFLEVTIWNSEGITNDWASALRKNGAKFIATRVWLMSEQRPSRAVSSDGSNDVTENKREENGEIGNEDSSKYNNSSFSRNSTQNSAFTSRNRTRDVTISNGEGNSYSRNDNLNNSYSSSFPKLSTHKQTVFKGVLECFIDLHSALVCVAHRSFTPLDFTDDWCDKSVCLERVVLNCCALKPSESDAPFSKDTVISNVINIGDYLGLTLEPYEKSPEQCYKWRAITCCKIEVPKLQLNTVSVHSLASDYLCGTIESVMEHDEGIINFITYTGFPAKAYFRREHFFSGNVPYMSGECLSNNVVIGTEVKLIVRTRLHENNEKDRNLLKEGVLFTAIKVWFTGNVKLLEKNMNESDFGHEPFPSCSSKEACENLMLSDNVEDEIYENIIRIKETEKQWINPMQPCNLLGSHDESEHGSHTNQSNMIDSISITSSVVTECTVVPETRNISSTISSKLIEDDNKRKSDFCSDVVGTLIALDENWGMVAVEDEVLPFDMSNTYLFGLQLQDIPLYKIFRYDQQVKVRIRSDEVLRLDYGLPQPFNMMWNSVLIYCERNQVTAEAQKILVQSMERQRMCSLAPVNIKTG